MARPSILLVTEYQPTDTQNAALWALVAVIAVTVAMEVYVWL